MASLSQPIKDLGKATLSKVAYTFIDLVIRKCTGKSIKIFEAEGDIEADKVKTKWEVLEEPVWLQIEAAKMKRQYSNLENTLRKSAKLITATENQIADDNDVFWGFFEHSKGISNEQMQELIAKIIAGEYNAPGTYSMSTLQIIKMLGQNELELFERIGSLLVNVVNCVRPLQIPQRIFGEQEQAKSLIEKVKLNFRELQTLQSLRLFLPREMSQIVTNTDKKNLLIQYFDKKLIFSPQTDYYEKIQLADGYYLSSDGEQILKHLTPKYVEKYYVWLKENYKIHDYKLLE